MKLRLLKVYISRRYMTTTPRIFEKWPIRRVIYEALDEELKRDKRVYILGEEVARFHGAYKVTRDLYLKHGEDRVIDTPITESGFTGLAIGSALAGLRPVVEYMSWSFCLQALDHIFNSAAKTFYMSAGLFSVPITFRGINVVDNDVAAQHSHCMAAMLAYCPGLKVIVPYTMEDHKGLLKSAIRDPDPVCFLEHEYLYKIEQEVTPELQSPDFLIPLGKAKVEKEGKDITLVSFSKPCHDCMLASAELEKVGISCEVINLRSLRPLDFETIHKSVKKTHRCLVVEYGWPYCSISATISANIMESPIFFELDCPVIRLCSVDIPMPYVESFFHKVVPGPPDIVSTVKKMLGHNK